MPGKLILICGAPRAGKTTIAVRLARERGFSRISFDGISEALWRGFPEISIKDPTDIEECAEKKFEFFKVLLATQLADAQRYGIDTVMDLCDFLPEYMQKLPFRNALSIYYLGFPDLTSGEIRKVIRDYADPGDWIAQVDDAYLTSVAQRICAINKKIRQQCTQYGYRFIDTGIGQLRKETLDTLFDEISAL